jgi:hypothetical protein
MIIGAAIRRGSDFISSSKQMPWILQWWNLLLPVVLAAVTSDVDAFVVSPGGCGNLVGTTRRKALPSQCVGTTSWSLLRAAFALEPPAITVDGLSCSHDGGDTWQLKDVSYVLPRGASKFSS